MTESAALRPRAAPAIRRRRRLRTAGGHAGRRTPRHRLRCGGAARGAVRRRVRASASHPGRTDCAVAHPPCADHRHRRRRQTAAAHLRPVVGHRAGGHLGRPDHLAHAVHPDRPGRPVDDLPLRSRAVGARRARLRPWLRSPAAPALRSPFRRTQSHAVAASRDRARCARARRCDLLVRTPPAGRPRQRRRGGSRRRVSCPFESGLSSIHRGSRPARRGSRLTEVCDESGARHRPKRRSRLARG